MLCGHDHTNNFVVPWHGVKLAYALKMGAGCYWKPELSGGTVIKIGSDGVKELYHEYVDPGKAE